MYEEIIDDVKNIVGLKTASDEVKARMIAELMMGHEEPQQVVRPRTEQVIKPEAPSVETLSVKRGPYQAKKKNRNKIWTSAEDLLLQQRYREELGRARSKSALYKKLGKEFGRTKTAIEIRLMKKGWKNPDSVETPNMPKKRQYKKGGKKIPVTQTEIDTVYRERKMGTSIKQIAKLMNVYYKRVETIDYKIRKGLYKPSNKKDVVDVGNDTSMPRKFSYMK